MSNEGNPVQGFTYLSIVDGDPRNDTICQILRRAEVRMGDLTDSGPAFVVVFGDGEVKTAFSEELHPWYPI